MPQALFAISRGGTDLSFLETSQALMELQQKTSDQACIIPGIICNDEMNDRVQVIMVITGLSGTPGCRTGAGEARTKN